MRISPDPPLPWLAERELEKSAELDRLDDGYTPPFELEPPEEPPKRRRWLVWLGRVTTALFTALLALCIFVASHIWYTPSSTAFMDQNPNKPLVYEWVDLDHISRYALSAAIAHEDPDFGKRVGAFDVSSFIGTAESYMGGQSDVVGGSTIPQQLVKNMYLSPDRSAWRKAAEAALATPYALILPDKRILELYMNYAQFGPSLYGICAASWFYFDTPPWSMTPYEAAQLASILPLPSLARRADDGGIYVIGPNSNAKFMFEVYTKTPNDIAYLGGYQAIMQRVGIDDEASDHVHDGDGSCSAMPAGVVNLLNDQGAPS